MAYDELLATRVRQLLSDRDHVREVTMFGGLAFMVDERMVVCVSGGGGDLLVRVSPEQDVTLIEQPGAARGQMGTGRSMGPGWIAVDHDVVRSEAGLQHWLDAALEFHASGSGTRTGSRSPKTTRAKKTR
ncbi:MAG: hypothetical protein CSA84_05335 [Actinomycetales bacterium]|nr:MAG: hypothetical protein CSA84_05335 [Actinomycetales bacterium]